MKKIRTFLASTMTAVLLSSIAIPSFASNATTEIPELDLETSSVCIDTSYQVSTFLTKEKVVYPQKSAPSKISSPFGPRIGVNPMLGFTTPEIHTGTDFSQGLGTPIYTVASGIVKKAGLEPYGDGQMIVIEHEIDGETWTTMYLHVMDADESIKVGERVVTGQQIAREGDTGNVTGSHLHFEVWEGEYSKGKAHDPKTWLQNNNAVDVTDESIPNFTCNKGTIFDGKIAAWGNVRNGEVPADKMSSLTFNNKFTIEKESAVKLDELNTEFKKEFDRNLPIISAYKSLEDQSADSKKITDSPLPGLATAGWGKSIALHYSNPEGGIKPLVDPSEYNPYDDIEYKWLLENSPRYGWVNPIINREGNTDPKPERFIFVGVEEATAQPSKEDLQKYARIAMMKYNWTDKESQCLIEKWETETKWDPAFINGDRIGIARTSMIEKFGANWEENEKVEEFNKSPRMQIEAGLKEIKETGKNPCGDKGVEHAG